GEKDVEAPLARLDADRRPHHAPVRRLCMTICPGRSVARERKRRPRLHRGHGETALLTRPLGPRGKCRARSEWIGGIDGVAVLGSFPWKRIQAEPESHRRIAGEQIQPFRPEKPRTAFPGGLSFEPPPAERERVAHDLIESLFINSGEAPAFFGVV